MRTSLEERVKLHWFAGIFPKQFFTEAGRYCEAVVATDQRMVFRCFGNDLADFVHDASHVPLSLFVVLCQEGKQDIGEVAEQADTNASRDCCDDGCLSRIIFHAPSLVAVERQR